MTGFRVEPLDETTWPEFARLVELHNGVPRQRGRLHRARRRSAGSGGDVVELEVVYDDGRLHTTLGASSPASLTWVVECYEGRRRPAAGCGDELGG